MVGIIGAMEVEVNELKAEISGLKTEKVGNLNFFYGRINNTEVCVVRCGIGKVNAALCASILVLKFGANEIINIGVAGGIAPDIKPFDMIIATDLVEHDFDLTAFGKAKGQLNENDFVGTAASEKLTNALCGICDELKINYKRGRIVSGDQFISSKEKSESLYKDFGAAGVEMEGAAMAHVCSILGVDFAVIRTISDSADDGAKGTFEENCVEAARIYLRLILKYLET